MLAAMIPAPGESPDEWWENTGYGAAAEEQAARDGGPTGNSDPFVGFHHDVARVLAEEAMRRERAHPSAAARTRLGIVADDIRGSHCVALSRLEELASILIGYAREVDPAAI